MSKFIQSGNSITVVHFNSSRNNCFYYNFEAQNNIYDPYIYFKCSIKLPFVEFLLWHSDYRYCFIEFVLFCVFLQVNNKN